MDDVKFFLKKEVDNYRALGYEELKSWVINNKIEVRDLASINGQVYQAEFLADWDDKENNSVRFWGSIARSRKLKNIFKSDLVYSFIINPDGSIVEG